MKVVHKQFGIVEIKGQNEKSIFIITESGQKNVMRIFAKNMIKNEDGSEVDFDSFDYIKEEEKIELLAMSTGRKVSKNATILGRLEQIDIENE